MPNADPAYLDVLAVGRARASGRGAGEVSLPRRVDVVGGGISGLTTAYRLAAAGVDVTVHEAADRPGGKLATTQVGDLRLETGADSFVARKPWAVDLCRELGLAGELVTPGAKGAYLWTDRGLVSFPKDAPFGIPGDIGDVFRWPGVSRAGRRRAAMDLLRGKRKDGVEETLGGLLRRRLGDEATDMAVAPLLAGLYAGDVDTLSARATFPELLMWESSQGSLIRGSQAAMRSVRRGTPTPMFVKPKGGVGRLTDALAASLGDRVVTGAPVGSLSELGERGSAGAIVLAVPSFEAGRLLGPTGSGRVRRSRRYPVCLDRRRVPGVRRGDTVRAAGGDRVRGPRGARRR